MPAKNNRLRGIILDTIAGQGPVTRDDIFEMLLGRCPRTIIPSRRELTNLLARMPELQRRGKEPGMQVYEYTGVGI